MAPDCKLNEPANPAKGDFTGQECVHRDFICSIHHRPQSSAALGNFVGAAIFVAGAYWYLYAKDEGEPSAGGVRTDKSDGAEAETATPQAQPTG